MLKNIVKSVALISFFWTTTTQALPIIEADAFITGDNKAVLETDTGLVWMDFGVNANKNFTSEMLFTDIVSNLKTTYKGWRLASQKEVTHLWFSLFDNQSITIEVQGPAAYRLADWDGALSPHFHDIADVFGYTWDSIAGTNRTGQEGAGEEFTIKSASAYFYNDDGDLASFDFFTPHTGVHLSDTTLISHNPIPLTYAYGAMLVKDTDVSVPEPTSLMLLMLGILGLVVRRAAPRR